MNRYIYNLGARMRNPNLELLFEQLVASDYDSISEIEEKQLEKLKSFLRFAGRYSEYYRNIFKSAGFDADQLKSFKDLNRIPILSKTDLLTHKNEISTVKNYRFKKLFFSETSGSSGQPLSFYKDEKWDSAVRAAMLRGYKWHDVNAWDRNGYFWGYNIQGVERMKTRFLDLIQNRFRVFSFKEDDIKQFIKKLKHATYLHGYSSMIYETAKIVNEQGIKFDHKLRMIKGTSEKIHEKYFTEIKKAFGIKIISEYGAAESGLIAFECKKGSMHIASENVFVEILDDEIVVTNLLSRSFPIIRYRLGDYVKLKDPAFKCSCGRQHPVIDEVTGRVGKLVYGINNKYPSLIFYNIFKNIVLSSEIILNYQVFQKQKGRLEVRIEESGSEKLLKIIRAEFDKYFENDMDFKILFNQNLHSMKKKRMDFISELN